MSYTELEKRIIRAAELGNAWADVHETWFQLDQTKKILLADLMNDLSKVQDEGGKPKSEDRLERLALCSDQYKDFIKNLALAKGMELRAKVRYEAAQAFYEAGRTRAADERARQIILKDIP